MPKTDLVPCFYWGQDSQNDKPAKVLLRSEIREMKKQNLGYFIDHGNAFRLTQEQPQGTSAKVEGADSSDSCISFEEMQANVGIVRDGMKNERAIIQAAQAKVRWYERIRSFPDLATGRHPVGVSA